MSAHLQRWCGGVVRQRLKTFIWSVADLSTGCTGHLEHPTMAKSAKTLTKNSPLPPLEAGATRLYSMRFCPFAQRARLVLAHKGVQYETLNIHLGNKPEWFPEKNPNGEVPVLEKDGNIVYDSLVVAEYLDQEYKKSPLVPENPLRKAHDAMIINYNGGKFVPNYYKILGSKGTEEEPIIAMMTALQKLEDFLAARKSTFFGGDKPAFIDFMIWPWHERLPSLKKFEQVDVSLTKFPSLKKWYAAMIDVPAVKTCGFSVEMHDKFNIAWKGGDPDAFDVGLDE